MRFEQMAELPQRGGVGHPLGLEIKAGETLQCLAVVERVFEGFVGPAIPVLEEIDAHHALQPEGRTPALAFGIEGFDDGEPLRPRDECLHARAKLFPAGRLLLGGKLGLSETRLVRHGPSLGNARGTVGRINWKGAD